MIRLLGLQLKAQVLLLPLLLVVVLFQLILGQASSYALTDREPPLSIAVQQKGEDALAQNVLEALQELQVMTIVEVDASLAVDTVFDRNNVQGLLVIPEDFGERFEADKRSLVQFYPAPGITNSSVVQEQIAAVILQMRAQRLFELALVELGETNTQDVAAAQGSSFIVEYDGPLIQSNPLKVTPVYGVSALLLLLAFLHTALTVPTKDSKRIVVLGKEAFAKQFFSSLFALSLVWACITALYFVSMAVFFGVALDFLVVAAFYVMLLYVIALAALLALLCGRQVATWSFLPLFLLNMTVGGGLWGVVAVSPLLAPLLPVTCVVVASMGDATGLVVLGSVAVGLLGLLGILNLRFSRKTTGMEPVFKPAD